MAKKVFLFARFGRLDLRNNARFIHSCVFQKYRQWVNTAILRRNADDADGEFDTDRVVLLRNLAFLAISGALYSSAGRRWCCLVGKTLLPSIARSKIRIFRRQLFGKPDQTSTAILQLIRNHHGLVFVPFL